MLSKKKPLHLRRKKKRKKKEKKKEKKEKKKKQKKKKKKKKGKKKKKKYDNGKDNWLAMNKNPNEWAVGLHGLKSLLQSANPITQHGLITDGAGQAYAAALDSRTTSTCVKMAILCPSISTTSNIR